MAQLSKTFQIPGYHPYSALKKVEETSKALTSRYLAAETVCWGPFASKSIKQVEDGTCVVDSEERRGRNVSEGVKKQTEKDAVAFVRCIVENLHSRFPNVELFKSSYDI